ncbi:MAG: hypothetical protein HY321_05280 [Armatimonadetes bacterium]|nr:hypothetical protein [Armatimonadota bacterium]
MTTVDRNHRLGLSELQEMAEKTFCDLVKAVVGVEREIMVVDADLHADQEAYLLEEGSDQNDLWGSLVGAANCRVRNGALAGRAW